MVGEIIRQVLGHLLRQRGDEHALARIAADADFLQERTEILQTTVADIRDCADLLRCVDCKNVCSIGKEQKIKENENQFTRIESLI